METTKLLTIAGVFYIVLMMTSLVEGHGRLVEPPSRSSAWRFGFPTPINYDDNELFCGGYQVKLLFYHKCTKNHGKRVTRRQRNLISSDRCSGTAMPVVAVFVVTLSKVRAKTRQGVVTQRESPFKRMTSIKSYRSQCS